MEEGGRNGMKQYDEGNIAPIEKNVFDVAKKMLVAEENSSSLGKGIIVEIGGRNGRLDYSKKLREHYDKPNESSADTLYARRKNAAPLGEVEDKGNTSQYTDEAPWPLNPLR